MKLNLIRPTLVITGLWNPAIFQPPWVAVTLLNVPPGADINFVEVFEAPGKVTHYFGDIGIGVPPGRLELFANVRADEKWTELENLALKILATLPHTPIQGLGINFRFEDDDPDPEAVDKLWTHEGLETRFEVVASAIRSRLKFEDCELGLAREITDGKFVVDFNFHHPDVTVETITKILSGSIAERLKRATALLLDVYGFEVEQSVVTHQFPATAAA
jgi:hypothetical protein